MSQSLGLVAGFHCRLWDSVSHYAMGAQNLLSF
jgi:hypothetical protein